MQHALHVLNSITVPMGEQMGTDSGFGEGRADHTHYGHIYDHRHAQLNSLLTPGSTVLITPAHVTRPQERHPLLAAPDQPTAAARQARGNSSFFASGVGRVSSQLRP